MIFSPYHFKHLPLIYSCDLIQCLQFPGSFKGYNVCLSQKGMWVLLLVMNLEKVHVR